MRLMEQNRKIASQRKSRADCYPIVLFFIVVAGRTFFYSKDLYVDLSYWGR